MSESKKTWDGLRVCPEDYEPRHPQDFVKGRAENIAVPDARGRPTPVFIDSTDITADDL